MVPSSIFVSSVSVGMPAPLVTYASVIASHNFIIRSAYRRSHSRICDSSLRKQRVFSRVRNEKLWKNRYSRSKPNLMKNWINSPIFWPMTVILMYRHLWKLTAKQRLLWHSITKTLQNGSRQLRTDRNLPRNRTDRPKDKVCETGSDSFRKRGNRTLSRSRERNPKTGTDNHNIGNITAGRPALRSYIYFDSRTPCKIFTSCRVFDKYI